MDPMIAYGILAGVIVISILIIRSRALPFWAKALLIWGVVVIGFIAPSSVNLFNDLKIYYVDFLLLAGIAGYVIALVAGCIWVVGQKGLDYALRRAVPAAVGLFLVMGVGIALYNRGRTFEGHLESKSQLASVRQFVREQLSVLPEGARDVYYSVRKFPPPSTRVTFHLGEGDFKDWMGKRDLHAIGIRGWPALDVEHDSALTQIEQGYYWSGDIRKSLTYEGAYLDVEVVYDSQSGKVYYEHREILPEPGSESGDGAGAEPAAENEGESRARPEAARRESPSANSLIGTRLAQDA